MNFKLKTLVAVLALSAAAATSANAATNGSTGNSSVIFSAWDANGSYSIDLGTYLNTLVGVETAGTTATNSSYTGAVAADGTILDTVLTGFTLTSGSWNLAAADTSGRYRMLLSGGANGITTTNNQVKNGGKAFDGYLGTGVDLTSAPTISLASDPTYAASAGWGDAIGSTAIVGTSNALGSSSNLYVAWMNSLLSAQGGNASGFANLTAGGNNVFATTYVDALGTHFKIATVAAVAAVPEADTSGMMLAGLGLMGFIARRRNRKQA